MTSHWIIVRDSVVVGRLVVLCQCDAQRGSMLGTFARDVPLDELNRLAHEHIEASDRTPFIR